jgi:hypothetical protein
LFQASFLLIADISTVNLVIALKHQDQTVNLVIALKNQVTQMMQLVTNQVDMTNPLDWDTAKEIAVLTLSQANDKLLAN